MSVFKERKIPKHLIIHEDYEYRQRPRMGLVKGITWGLLLVVATYAVSTGLLSF